MESPFSFGIIPLEMTPRTGKPEAKAVNTPGPSRGCRRGLCGEPQTPLGEPGSIWLTMVTHAIATLGGIVLTLTVF